MSVIINCECGCEELCPIHRTVLVRTQWHQGHMIKPGRTGYWVRKEHRDAFERELANRAGLNTMMLAERGLSFWHRLGRCAFIYDQTREAFQRTKGAAAARRMAWSIVKLFLFDPKGIDDFTQIGEK